MVEKKQRDSGIELLRILAMFAIVVTHSLPKYGDATAPYYIDINSTMSGWYNYMVYLIMDIGYVGLAFFVIIAAWFLVDSKGFSKEKFWSVVIDTVLISVLWLIAILLLGFPITFHQIVNAFLPIVSANNWFIGCYLMLYLMHPLFNMVINGITKRQHLILVLISVFVYGIIAMVRPGVYYNNEFVAFVMVYFITAYIKRYLQNAINQRTHILARLIVWTCLLLVSIYLLQNFVPVCNSVTWLYNFNPIILGISFSLLFMFIKFHFYSRFVNKLAGLTLLIYLIHENLLFREFIKPIWWSYVYDSHGYYHLLGWILLTAVVLFLGSALVAWLYSLSVHRVAIRIWKWLDKKSVAILQPIIDRWESYS